jgi:phage tail-like protein
MTMPLDGQSQSYQAGCFFYVYIGSGGARGVFAEVSGFNAEVEITKYKEGGMNNQPHMMPGAATIGNIVLKRGIVDGNEFFKWFREILNGNVKRQNITISMFGPGGVNGNDPLYSWDLVNAFPCKWSTTNLSAEATTLVIETIELAHEGFGDTTL